MRKHLVSMQSIVREREKRMKQRVIVRKGSEYLTKLQPKTSKKLP